MVVLTCERRPYLAVRNSVTNHWPPAYSLDAYDASKVAFHAYSNTLRVELAPFGVKVVTIVIGGLKSNIARVERSPPPRSVHIPINEEYQRRFKYSEEVGMPNEDYTCSVVSKALGKSSPRWV